MQTRYNEPLRTSVVCGQVPTEARGPKPSGVGISKPLWLADLTHFPTFSGQVLTQIPQEFLKSLEENLELMRLSESDKLLVATRRLFRRALGWFSQAKRQLHTYSDFVRLLTQFSDERLKKMKLRRLQNVKFTNSDSKSIVDFVWGIAKTYRDLCGNGAEEELLEILLEVLPLSISRTMRLLKPENAEQH